MEQESEIYVQARLLFEDSKTEQEVKMDLLRQGYDIEDIEEALKEYHKDEKTRDDDKLIHKIERRFNGGEDIHSIIQSLIAEGYNRFEVEKAVLRSNLKG